MLVRCNSSCRKSNGQTDASLDVESDCIVCNTCGDTIDGLSDFCKISMKANGDIVRTKARKAFTFSCSGCNRMVEAKLSDGKLVGKLCSNDGKGCKINVTEAMMSAIASVEGSNEQ